ncbi:MAG: hypothetical protein WCX29_00760 [Candidatus Peribacteraceae bacterium]|nr:hypothetical protein [Candidatus Peribacteria bacterium]
MPHIQLLHLCRRKRDPHLAPLPHPRRSGKVLDQSVLLISVIAPFASLPQITQIYSLRSAADLSLATWVLFAIFHVPMLAYGIVHKEKVMMLYLGLALAMESTIITGIVLYG